MNAILLALLIGGSPEPVKALEQHRVEVRVTMEDKLELPGVTVTVRRPGLARTVVTDVQGTAVFENLAPAAYEVNAELEGFRRETKRLAVGADVVVAVE